jgi:hypothetical protein
LRRERFIQNLMTWEQTRGRLGACIWLKAVILYGGEEHYPVSDGIEAIGLRGLCDVLAAIG